jgi:dihydroxyacid dehydratase/phosphogluconate dehydratase
MHVYAVINDVMHILCFANNNGLALKISRIQKNKDLTTVLVNIRCKRQKKEKNPLPMIF